jgi:hypothetical protein
MTAAIRLAAAMLFALSAAWVLHLIGLNLIHVGMR